MKSSKEFLCPGRNSLDELIMDSLRPFRFLSKSVTKVHPVISHYPGAVFDYPKIRKKGEF
jgi:hypothetical protein